MAIVTNGLLANDLTLAASIASDVLDMQGGGSVGLHIVSASNTHVGTYAVQLSNDNSNWVSAAFYSSAGVLSTSIATSSGAALNDVVEMVDVTMRYLRVYYTATSGAGTVTIRANRKGG